MESYNSATLSGLSDNPTIEELMNLLIGNINTATADRIDKEVGPLLNEVTLLGRYDYHSWSEKLFNWLVNPRRTVDEISYAVGPLAQKVLQCYHGDDDSSNRDSHSHFGQCLAEALAVRDPVLEGSWEHVAWLLVKYTDYSFPDNICGRLSDSFEDWLIKVTGDYNLCPNPYLRIELLSLFGNLVFPRDDTTRVKALHSVMFAWSSLEYGQLINYISLCYKGNFFTMDPDKIYSALYIFEEDKILLNLDQKLSDELRYMKLDRLSSILRGVSYKCENNAYRYKEPMELRAVSALLTSISLLARFAHAKEDTNMIENTASALNTLVKNFRRCCMMPQLIGEVTDSIFHVMYYVLLSEDDSEDDDDDFFSTSGEIKRSMYIVESVLSSLTLPSGITNPCMSPIGRELIIRNELGFKCIKEAMVVKNRDLRDYRTMFCLVYRD